MLYFKFDLVYHVCTHTYIYILFFIVFYFRALHYIVLRHTFSVSQYICIYIHTYTLHTRYCIRISV